MQGLLVVARGDDDTVEYAIYVRTSWTRGYRILRTWRDRADRTFRSLDKLFKLPAAFGYHHPITVYKQGCVELQKFKGVLPKDGGERTASTVETVDDPEPETVAEASAHMLPTD